DSVQRRRERHWQRRNWTVPANPVPRRWKKTSRKNRGEFFGSNGEAARPLSPWERRPSQTYPDLNFQKYRLPRPRRREKYRGGVLKVGAFRRESPWPQRRPHPPERCSLAPLPFPFPLRLFGPMRKGRFVPRGLNAGHPFPSSILQAEGPNPPGPR